MLHPLIVLDTKFFCLVLLVFVVLVLTRIVRVCDSIHECERA